MEDIIDIIVTETTNLIEITSQPTDEIIDVNIIDNREDVTLNVTPTLVEININSLTGNFGVNWGEIAGTLSNQTDLQNTLNLKADLVDGKVPSSQLPSYVDDVVEVATFSELPATGEVGKIYIILDTNKIYRWSGSVYVEIADSTAVWGAITGTLSSQTDLQNALNLKANDNAVVHLATSETITGTKTFEQAPLMDIGVGYKNGSGVYNYLKSINTGWEMPVNGQNHNLIFSTSTNYVYTFPNATGTIALTSDLSSYVPYTGATANVNLGNNDVTAGSFTGGTGSFATSGAGNTVAINHSSGSGIALNITKSGSGEGIYVNKSSGSGNAVTIVGTLNATTLVKSGGTSSQFLKADGSVDSSTYLTTGTAASTYLPLAGGTMTGNLFGTNASFSGNFTSTNNTGFKNDNATQAGFVANYTGTNAINVSLSTYNNTFSIFNETNGYSIINFTRSTKNLVFNSTGGNVGIGIDLPTSLLDVNGTGNFRGALTATSFIKSSGTSSQFLKADGSVDSNTYLTTGTAISTYLPLSGGTLTGDLNGVSATFTHLLTGTSALFTSNVTIRPSTGYNAYFQTSGTSVRINYLNNALSTNIGASFRATDYSFQDGSGSPVFTIASTGASTFSSSVRATTGLTVGSLGSGIDAIITLETNASGSGRSIYYKASTATINFTQTGGADLVTITNGGSLLVGKTSGASKFAVVGLPTSSAGLSSGDFYQVAGAVMVVP